MSHREHDGKTRYNPVIRSPLVYVNGPEQIKHTRSDIRVPLRLATGVLIASVVARGGAGGGTC